MPFPYADDSFRHRTSDWQGSYRISKTKAMTLRELINSVDSELYSDRSTTKGDACLSKKATQGSSALFPLKSAPVGAIHHLSHTRILRQGGVI